MHVDDNEVQPGLQHSLTDEARDHDDIENSSGINNTGGSQTGGPRWRKDRGETSARILDTSREKACVTMHVPGSGVRPFHFNNVFIDKTNQQTIYNDSARDLVTAALNGMNSCLLCYGQTGSGKTYTMFGPDDVCDNMGKVTGDRQGKSDLEVAESIISSSSATGIVFRACAELLRAKVMFEKRGNVSINLHVQFVEIYNDIVTDLMSGKRLSVQRRNGELNGAVETKIDNIDSVIDLLNEGHTRKHFAATAMNERSSRAHTAFIVQISQTFHDETIASDHKLLKSQLYLVDLAGSERVKKSKAMGNQLVEAKSINSSLLVLGKVITRLSRSDIHVPYFESQLTTLLKGAFGGNSKTGVIVTCRSDDKTHGDETLQSLRFGELCGMITNATRQAASCSLETLLATLDTSIEKVSLQLESLKQRGKQHLPSFLSLENKLTELRTRRVEIDPSSTPLTTTSVQ
jgi:kinesin family protein 5